MIIDNTIDKRIAKKIIADNEEREANHISSGKLSASMLGEPLQWQILKAKGVKPKEFDEYTLRKFKRGKDVELEILPFLETIVEADGKQDFVEYRNVVGYVDATCDTKDWEFNVGVIPVEVKSTSNAKYKRILKQGPDRNHCLQGCLYALARGTDHFAVLYVATDDYRTITYILKTEDYKDQVDKIIDKYEAWLKDNPDTIPVFECEEKWQESEDYNKYYEWSKLSADEIKEKYANISEHIKSNNNVN